MAYKGAGMLSPASARFENLTTAPTNQTLKDRVSRILTVSQALVMEASDLNNKLQPSGLAGLGRPSPDDGPPTPEHLVFMLEQIEQNLDAVRKTTHASLEAAG